MKKALALLVALSIFIFCFTLTVSAESDKTGATANVNIGEAVEKEYLYREKLDEYLSTTDFYKYGGRHIASYDELYYHRDENGEIDWALIKAAGYRDIEIGAYKVGNRVIRTNTSFNVPFHLDLAVYDVEKETFVDLALTGFKTEAYDGLGRYVDENCKGLGILLGDIDRDDELSIIDCTLIQRCAAKVIDWPEKDQIDLKPVVVGFPDLRYYSDFDCDGERDVVDATKLQRYVTMID